MAARKILLSIFACYYILKLFLSYLGYLGDDSLETEKLLLKYFSETQISDGIAYSQRGYVAKMVNSGLMALVLLWLAFSGFSQKVEKAISKRVKEKHYLANLSFIATLLTFFQIIALPASYYFGYYLEHKFEFSNLTTGGWLLLQLKSYAVSLIIIPPVGAFLLFLIKKFKRSWVFVATAFFLFFQLATSYLQPYLILPLFYQVSPLTKGDLRDEIKKLAQKENISLENIFVIDASTYSKHTNAFFTGWGNEKRIYLFDTLQKQHSDAEIISILGHEMGHWKLNHVLLSTAMATVSFFCMLLLLKYIFVFLKRDKSLPLKEFTDASSLPVLGLSLSILSFVFSPLATNMSRTMEHSADQYALEVTNDRASFISTEKKLAVHNKSRLNPHSLYVWFYYSHPPAIKRIGRGEKFKKHE